MTSISLPPENPEPQSLQEPERKKALSIMAQFFEDKEKGYPCTTTYQDIVLVSRMLFESAANICASMPLPLSEDPDKQAKNRREMINNNISIIMNMLTTLIESIRQDGITIPPQQVQSITDILLSVGKQKMLLPPTYDQEVRVLIQNIEWIRSLITTMPIETEEDIEQGRASIRLLEQQYRQYQGENNRPDNDWRRITIGNARMLQDLSNRLHSTQRGRHQNARGIITETREQFNRQINQNIPE